MTIDLVILGAIALFAVLGAVSGAARQIAYLCSIAAAYFAAPPVGRLLGPAACKLLGTQQAIVGQVAAMLAAFLVVLIGVRWLLGAALRRLFAGSDPEDRSTDRALGFFLGALKSSILVYVVLSALAFVEQNVIVAGKRLGVSPRDSLAFALARRFNLFELTQFSGVKELAQLAKASSDPAKVRKLNESPSFKLLQKDRRFQSLLEDEQVLKAVEAGDYRKLLENEAVLKLIQDPVTAQRLADAARYYQVSASAP